MSFENVQKLIKCVQSHPMLYDKDHDQYKEINTKDKLWAELGIKCGINNCKKYWHQLRDCHRDALKRYERKIKKGKDTKKWKHQDDMAFLEKHIKRKVPDNSSISTVYNETISEASLDIFFGTSVILKEEQSEVNTEEIEEQLEEKQIEKEGIEEEDYEDEEAQEVHKQEAFIFSNENNKDKTEALIESVREYPELYNTEQKLYMDSKYIEEIWVIIAAKCDIKSISEAKKMWQNLCDCHREAIKRRNWKIEKGQNISSIRKWKHHDAMAFLEQHIDKKVSSAPAARIFVADFGAMSEDSFEYEPKRRKIETFEAPLNLKMAYGDTERFIKCIQIHPELYNTDYTKYRDVKHKEDVWVEIAEECGMKDANEAKKIWHNLRDAHRKAFKTRHAKIMQGNAQSIVKKWKQNDAMSFLENFMTCRDKFRKMSTNSPEPGETNTSESTISTILQDDMLDIPTENLHKQVGHTISDVDFDTEPKYNQPLKGYETPKKKDLFDKSKDVLHGSEHIEKCSQRRSNPALYNFFISLYETALQFPPLIQCQVKKEMFNIMINYEEQLSAGTSTPTVSKI